MKQLFPVNEITVYPGTYVPLFNHETCIERVKQYGHRKTDPYSVQIHDESEAYRIDITVPGLKSENFLVDADSHELNVIVRECIQESQDNFKFSDCAIMLPESTDPAFIFAHYQSGILHLYVPKAKDPVQRQATTVVVY